MAIYTPFQNLVNPKMDLVWKMGSAFSSLKMNQNFWLMEVSLHHFADPYQNLDNPQMDLVVGKMGIAFSSLGSLIAQGRGLQSVFWVSSDLDCSVCRWRCTQFQQCCRIKQRHLQTLQSKSELTQKYFIVHYPVIATQIDFGLHFAHQNLNKGPSIYNSVK